MFARIFLAGIFFLLHFSGPGIPSFACIDYSVGNPVLGNLKSEHRILCFMARDGVLFYLEEYPRRFRIIDFSDPSSPTELGATYLTSYPYLGVLHGDLALLCDDRKFLVLDISDLQHPVQVGEISLPENPRWFSVHGDLVFLPDNWQHFFVLDISDPAQPVILSDLPVDGYAEIAAVYWPYVLLFCRSGPNKIHVVDVSDPSQPLIVHTMDFPWSAVRIHILGQFALVTTRSNGITVLDLNDPIQPEIIGGISGFGGCLTP